MEINKEVGLDTLIDMVKNFCQERDWDQFHNPKDLAIGISTEANELLDLFRFKSDEQMKQMMADEKARERIEEEIADVFFFVLRFAQMNDLDLKKCMETKLYKNAQKYPVDKCKGKNLKYNDLK